MDWRQSAAQCANRIRALSVRGPVKVRIKDRDVGLFCPKVSERDFHAPPGTVLRVDDQILFATTQGILSVSEVQIPGQKQRRQVSSVRDLLSNSRMTSRRSDLISAALRHRRTARLLFDTPAQDRSLDQAYHLAGFGPECARNACLSDSWAGPALGHGFSDEQAQHQDYLLTLDAHAQRYVRTNWSTKHPELVNWGVHSRYLHTGAHEYDRVKALLDASEEVVDQITLALWADGLIDDGALR